jgi:hypothetical protein
MAFGHEKLVAMLTKLGQRGDAEELGEYRVSQFDTDTDTDTDTDQMLTAVTRFCMRSAVIQ